MQRPIAIAQGFFVQIAEHVLFAQMKMRSLDAAFLERPEVFEVVGVHLTSDVFSHVVNRLLVVIGKSHISTMSIGEQVRPLCDLLAHALLMADADQFYKQRI